MKLILREDGPLVVPLPEGSEVRLNGHPVRLSKKNLALCRCGASEKKPFCDKSHRRVGFKAPGGVLEWDTPPPEAV